MKPTWIVCTQSREAFNKMKQNVERHLPNTFRFVPVYNAGSIAMGYNWGANKGTTKSERRNSDILIFAHDDIKIRFDKPTWEDFAKELKKSQNGIGGVAGFRTVRRDPQGSIWPPLGGFGSGGCLHGADGQLWYTTFGLFGRTLTLDGIFLAMRREVFDELGGFSTEYPGWHWYDNDITFRSHLLGYRNFTFPLSIEHGTTNYRKDGYCVDQDEFWKHAKIFFRLHGDILPQTVECNDEELEARVFSREARWGQVKDIA